MRTKVHETKGNEKEEEEEEEGGQMMNFSSI